MLSTKGRCFTFDESARPGGLSPTFSERGRGRACFAAGGDGYARGEGCGLIFLKVIGLGQGSHC